MLKLFLRFGSESKSFTEVAQNGWTWIWTTSPETGPHSLLPPEVSEDSCSELGVSTNETKEKIFWYYGTKLTSLILRPLLIKKPNLT